MEVDGNVHITVMIYDSSFQQFGLTIDPSRPSASQGRRASASSRKRQTSPFTWSVVFSEVTRGTTYTYSLVPQGANGDTIGTTITGTFVLPKCKYNITLSQYSSTVHSYSPDIQHQLSPVTVPVLVW